MNKQKDSEGVDFMSSQNTTYYPVENVLEEENAFTWTWQETLLAIPLTLIVLGAIFGNLLVLYCIFTKRISFNYPTHYLIANLTMADFLVAVFVLPFLATLQITGRWSYGYAYCATWTLLHFLVCSASILSTCAISIERYIGVRFPTDYRTIMGRNRVWGLIAGCWIIAGILTLCSIFVWPEHDPDKPHVCQISQQVRPVIVMVVATLYVTVIITIILYWQIFIIASKHLEYMKKNMPTSGQSIHETKKVGIARFSKRFRNTSSISDNESEAFTTEVIVVSTSSPHGSSEDIACLKSQQGTRNEDNAQANTDTTLLSRGPSRIRNDPGRKQIVLAKRLGVLVGVLLTSFVPYFTLYMMSAFHPELVSVRVVMTFRWIRYFNVCLNPFIYAYALEPYREAMIKTISRFRCWRN